MQSESEIVLNAAEVVSGRAVVEVTVDTTIDDESGDVTVDPFVDGVVDNWVGGVVVEWFMFLRCESSIIVRKSK